MDYLYRLHKQMREHMTKVVTGGKDFFIYQWKHVEPGEIAPDDEPFHTWGHDPS